MLSQRILTAFILAVLFIPALFLLAREAWILVTFCVLYGCAWEWAGLSGLTALKRIPYALFIVCIAIVVTYTELSWTHKLAYCVSLLFWILIAPWLLWRRPGITGIVPRLLMGTVVLIPVQLALVELRTIMPGLLLAIMAIAWVSDSAAYFTGRSFGRHKLAPDVSPGKTWEGVYGALAAVLSYAIISTLFIKPLITPGWLAEHSMLPTLIVMLWLVLASAGIVGDLLESYLKRIVGVKDSSGLLPGHGGILDRVDALLPILPIAALFYLG